MSWMVLFFFLPTQYTEDALLSLIDQESAMVGEFWSQSKASEILRRAESIHAHAAATTPVPKASDAPAVDRVHPAIGREMAAINQRLFDNGYFRAVDAMVALAAYRCAVLLAWLPWMLPLLGSTVADGLAVRAVKASTAAAGRPAAFGALCTAAVLIACCFAVSLLVTMASHPMVLPAAVAGLAFVIGAAVSSLSLSAQDS